MPKIPTYEQQVSTNAAPANTRMPTNRTASSTGAGLVNLSEGMGRLAQGLERQGQVDFALEKDRIETEGRVWAANASSKADLDMTGFLNESSLAAPDGAPGFTPSFLDNYDKYTSDALKNAPSQFARAALQDHMTQSRVAFGRAAMNYESDERARYTGQQIDDGVGMSATIVNSNPATFTREMGKWASTIGAANVPAEAKQKLRDLARGQLVNAAVLAWINQDPTAAQKDLKAAMADPYQSITASGADGMAYDIPVHLGTLEERLRWSEYAEREADKLVEKTQINLRYEIQNMEAGARIGVLPEGPVRTRADFATFKDPATADYEFARYTTARETALAVSSLSGKSSADLLGVIQAKPDAGDPNLAVTVNNQEIRARAAADIINQRNTDPVAYAMQSGDFGLQPLNPGDPAAFSEELKRRAAALPVMAEKYGTASVMAKPEAEALGRQLGMLPAIQKVEQLEAMKTSLSDLAVYNSVLNAIAPGSPVTAAVGHIAAAGFRDNAMVIATGEDLLNPKDGSGRGKFPMPTESLLRSAWMSQVGDAYRGYPDAEDTAYQSYRAYYAAVAAKRGGVDTAGVDSDISDEAISAATGGVMQWNVDFWGNDTPSEMRGSSIVLPYGMLEDVFMDSVTLGWNNKRGDFGLPSTDVTDVGMLNTGADGEYLILSGTSYMATKNGGGVLASVKGGAASFEEVTAQEASQIMSGRR